MHIENFKCRQKLLNLLQTEIEETRLILNNLNYNLNLKMPSSAVGFIKDFLFLLLLKKLFVIQLRQSFVSVIFEHTMIFANNSMQTFRTIYDS